MATYTVKKGDCLWNIAKAKLGNATRWTEIAKLNNISTSNPIIYPNQVLQLPSTSSSTTTKTNTSNQAKIEYFGLLAGTDNQIFAAWSWDKSPTEKYQIKWQYTTGGGIWVNGSITSNSVDSNDPSSSKQDVYTFPDNAKQIRFYVKPIAKKETKNNKETTPWSANWSTVKTFYAKDLPPDAPPAPSNVTIQKVGLNLQLKVEVTGIERDPNVLLQALEVQVVKNDKTVVYQSRETINTSSVTAVYKVEPGNRYKVRCRMYNAGTGIASEWSAYSSNVYSPPIAPTKLKAKALSENDVYLEWAAVANVTGYEYQYATKREYFDTSSEVKTGSVDNTVHCANLVDLETGNFTYFFRVRSKGEGGESEWSSIVSLTLGKAPAAPTTWSSTTNAIVGKPVSLYWVHNSEDGSSQTYAKIEIKVEGDPNITEIVKKNTYTDEDDKDNTSEYVLDTSAYPEGAKLLWRVRTSGVLEQEYGDWSVQREIDIYAQPTIDLSVTKNLDGEVLVELNSFPFYVEASAGPASQLPIGYHLKIVANEGYETVDRVGNPLMVSAGEAVYSKYFDNNFEINGVAGTSLYVMLTPSVIDLENNIEYTLTCTVSMDSGLTAEDSITFKCAWEDISYAPNAEIGYDPDTYSTNIRPHCEDENGNAVEGIVLAVYRREYDGSYTELMTDIPNNGNTFITDPHPALDYARYRVVATTKDTGAIGYSDISAYPIGESAAIIQWNEDWSMFDSAGEESLATPAWTGSLVRLPYNIDISSSNAKDVALVEYIGREHPVAYYGTQLGETATLKTDIPATDVETLYALRRLMRWKGNAYVRLPNGVGYWATVSVQYNENHCEVKIPITIDITRVEGGV